jgi:hypothetical protein
MNQLPKAQAQPDGSLLVPAETRELLHRVLADISQGAEIGDTELAPGEAEALAELLTLLGGGGRLRPLWQILGKPAPRRSRPELHRVK